MNISDEQISEALVILDGFYLDDPQKNYELGRIGDAVRDFKKNRDPKVLIPWHSQLADFQPVNDNFGLLAQIANAEDKPKSPVFFLALSEEGNPNQRTAFHTEAQTLLEAAHKALQAIDPEMPERFELVLGKDHHTVIAVPKAAYVSDETTLKAYAQPEGTIFLYGKTVDEILDKAIQPWKHPAS